jgi:hypothetical protein
MNNKPDFEAAARDARSIETNLAMLQAAITAGQPAPALAGGILAAAERLLVIFGQTTEPSVRNDFPGVDMGMLAYDISEAIDNGEYPCLDWVTFSEIEPNLPAFLAACKATADADPS